MRSREHRISATCALTEERITDVESYNVNMLLVIYDNFNMFNRAHHEVA